MSVHNVEVHRCRECNEVVLLVPAGFTATDEEVQAKAEAHVKECRATLERMSDDAGHDD